jgi:hypothetical protein
VLIVEGSAADAERLVRELRRQDADLSHRVVDSGALRAAIGSSTERGR